MSTNHQRGCASFVSFLRYTCWDLCLTRRVCAKVGSGGHRVHSPHPQEQAKQNVEQTRVGNQNAWCVPPKCWTKAVMLRVPNVQSSKKTKETGLPGWKSTSSQVFLSLHYTCVLQTRGQAQFAKGHQQRRGKPHPQLHTPAKPTPAARGEARTAPAMADGSWW